MLKDYSLAVKNCREAADRGDVSAQFNLGTLYGLGLGVDQDYAEAVRWYRQSAEGGEPRAQSNLGFMYGTGRGVPQDYIQAYAWYNIAAAGGQDVARKNRDIVAEKMNAAQLEHAQKVSMELFEKIDRK